MKRFVFAASCPMTRNALLRRLARSGLCALSGVLWSGAVIAQAGASASAPDAAGSDSFIGSLLVVSLLLACAWTVLYVWRRERHLALGGGSDAMVHVLGVTSLGMRERVAVLRVRERTLVVGVTATQITLLAELSAPDARPPPTA